jgi:UDP-N-acetylmuramate--alanine ligase
VIYTPAIPNDQAALVFYRNQGYTLLKRSQVLGLLTNTYTNICVAGTHGKTTVSTMVSHLLTHTGYGCNAFLGGISVNYQTNFLSSSNPVCVIEADEYDRSFLQLSPTVAIITSMDADHLDIYGTHESLEEAFIKFSGQIQPNGLLIAKYNLKHAGALQGATRCSYHLNDSRADAYAENIRIQNGGYLFDVAIKGKRIENVLLNVGGLHNVENVIAAILVADYLFIDPEKIKAAVESYKGVKRRFEYILAPGMHRNIIMIDDYAHHPAELTALINGAASLFPNCKITIVFQPHLYSRTRDFAKAFSESLSLADAVILLPLYPARELPINGISSAILLEGITSPFKKLLDREAFLNWVQYDFKIQGEPSVLLMAGAGDIDLLLKPVKEILEN